MLYNWIVELKSTCRKVHQHQQSKQNTGNDFGILSIDSERSCGVLDISISKMVIAFINNGSNIPSNVASLTTFGPFKKYKGFCTSIDFYL